MSRTPPIRSALIDEFEATFQRAVEIRLRADVPVVGYLSGGVDSAYVLATASKIAGRPLPSFTIKVPLPALDEAADARESSSHIGGAATVIEAEAGVLAENYAELTRAAEYPVLDTSSAALLALSRNVHAQGYKVVLSGEGADEAFAGYVWFKIREAARKLDIGDSFRPSTGLSRIARKVAARNLSFGEFARIDAMIGGPHAQSIMYNLVATSRDRYYSAELKERLGSFVAYEDLALDLERMRRWHPLNRSLYLGCKVHLAGLLLNQKGDRVAMANSVEARYPFLDEDVIAFASRHSPALEAARADGRQISAATGRGAHLARCGGAAEEGHVPRAARRDLPGEAAVLRARSGQPRFTGAHRIFRCGRRATGLRSVGAGRTQARHLREPRPRRRGRYPALAPPLSRRRIVRTAACRASGRGRACGRKAGASALSGPCSAMKRLRIARAGPPVSTLVMTVAGSGFFSAVRCNSYGQRR